MPTGPGGGQAVGVGVADGPVGVGEALATQICPLCAAAVTELKINLTVR
jgi:hypothetical protein